MKHYIDINGNLIRVGTQEEFNILNKVSQEKEDRKQKIKELYGCEKSTLNFNIEKEHIEKFTYKGQTCYKIVSNK